MYSFLPADHISTEFEVYIHYYSQIVCCIPAKALCPYFVNKSIILPEHHQEILDVSSNIKAAGLLLSNISSALIAGITKIFYIFLDITEQYGNSDCKTIITAIREKLLEFKSKLQFQGM